MSLAILAGKQVLKNLKILDEKNLEQEKSNLEEVTSTINKLDQLSCLSSERPLMTAFTGIPHEYSPIISIRYLFEPISIEEEDISDSIESGFNPDDFETRDDFVNKMLQHYIFYRQNCIGTELHDCLEKGDIKAFNKLLDMIPEKFISDLIKIKNKQNQTILHLAIQKGYDNLAEKILEKMPVEGLSIQDNKGQTVLHLVAEGLDLAIGTKRSHDLAEKIFEKMPIETLSIKNANDDTALDLAIISNNETLAKKILEKKLPESLEDFNKILHFAIYKNLKNLAEKILEKIPAEALIIQFSGQNPLCLAMSRDQETLAKKILEKMPANALNIEHDFNHTVLHLAIMHGYENLAEKIVKKMPIETLRIKNDYDGKTALDAAIDRGYENLAIKIKAKLRYDLIKKAALWSIPLITGLGIVISSYFYYND